MENLKNRVFTELLPFVTKPGRYTGNEFNTHPKNWADVDLTFALIFPELYELGMSYVGFDILYHILNKQPKIAAERVYAPDVDLEALLREKNIPLFSLENKMPLAAFDILGFTFQYELHVTNILNIIDLAQLPVYSRERDESHPLVVIGGPCAHNPEPIADFVDVVVLGDGEEIILEMCQAVTTAKAEKQSREMLLRELSRIDGIYVPKFYEIKYQDSGEIKSVEPIIPEARNVVTARILDSLAPQNYPEKPIVPLIPITHDRFSMEIMRGCTRGCRFCNAGMIYRPVRERPVDELSNYAKTVIEKTGYEEFSLVSLSSSDYTHITELLTRLSEFTEDKQVRLSLPSLRPETFSSQVAQHASGIKKSGLTLAPEAGTERLRRVINKTNSNADLLNAVKTAFENGWQLIKLYFMIGQPTETTEDLDGIILLINDVVKLAKSYGGKKVNVSLSPFTPKAHTPFQWERQNSLDEFREKVNYIRKQQKYRSLKINWRDPEVAFAEGVISRGDRRVGQVILNAWQNGAKFDAWTQYFSFENWQKAYDSAGIQPEFYHRQHEIDGLLPWQHLSLGVTDAYLKLENQRAHRVEETGDCRLSGCNGCGLMQHPVCQTLQKPEDIPTLESTAPETAPVHPPRERTTSAEATHLRIKYAKGQTMRFLSHLDIIRIFERSFRRAGIPILYSQGFHPHPKISFSPPPPLGIFSSAEYLDVQFEPMPVETAFQRLQESLPPDLLLLEHKHLFGKYQSLTSVVNRIDYSIIFPAEVHDNLIEDLICQFHSSTEFLIERERKGKRKTIDLKHYVPSLSFDQAAGQLKIVTRMDNGKTVRIDEILTHILQLSTEQKAKCEITKDEMYIEFGQLRKTPIEI